MPTSPAKRPRTPSKCGWPQEITYAELKPYYDTVAKFMNVQPVPGNQWTNRMKLMKEAAGQDWRRCAVQAT